MGWNAALVFSYGLPIAGREAAALESLADGQVFFGKMAADGRCAEPEVFHHGYGGGMMIVKAETPAALHDILMMDEARKLITGAMFTTTNFHYEMFLTGEELADGMARYAGVGTELGYL
jgi:hypothetical protein